MTGLRDIWMSSNLPPFFNDDGTPNWMVVHPADVGLLNLFKQQYFPNETNMMRMGGYPVWQSVIVAPGKFRFVPENLMREVAGDEWDEYLKMREESVDRMLKDTLDSLNEDEADS